MKIENAVLMKMARESLKGKWGLAIGALVVFEVISIVVQVLPKIGWIASLIITGPMTLGFVMFFLAISRNQEVKMEQIFKGFSNFAQALAAYLLMMVFVILWALLLIIPGIIAALSYAMTFYIMADDNSLGAMAAIAKSKQMMKGNKWKLFCLHLRFIGWSLLAILTLGVGFLWLIPYMQVSIAKFYDDIKEGSTVSENVPAQVV